MMISSMRLRNSGRKLSRMAWVMRLSSSCCSPRVVNSWIHSLPMLEVITMMVFLKSTVRPLPSVRRPSSSTCKRTLNTSRWAFSISSNSTTL